MSLTILIIQNPIMESGLEDVLDEYLTPSAYSDIGSGGSVCSRTDFRYAADE